MKRVFNQDIIFFGPRQCIRMTVVDPIFYQSFAIFEACVLSNQILSVSKPTIAVNKQSWSNVVDQYMATLRKQNLRGVIDVLCIKNTRPQDTWKIFVDPEEEKKRIGALTYLFQYYAQLNGIDLRVFPYGPNEAMVDSVQSYIEDEEIKHEA